MGGYTVDASQAKNVEQALKNCGKKNYEKIDNGNGSITYIFDITTVPTFKQTNSIGY